MPYSILLDIDITIKNSVTQHQNWSKWTSGLKGYLDIVHCKYTVNRLMSQLRVLFMMDMG